MTHMISCPVRPRGLRDVVMCRLRLEVWVGGVITLVTQYALSFDIESGERKLIVVCSLEISRDVRTSTGLTLQMRIHSQKDT